MQRFLVLMLVLGMTSLADAAIYVNVEVDGMAVTELEPLDIVDVIVGNDTPAAGGTTDLVLNVSQAQDGSGGMGYWPFPDPAIITPDGSGGLDFAFPSKTIGLNVIGDWLWAKFTVPNTAAIGSTVDLSWSGTMFMETPANASLSVVPEPATIALLGLGGLALLRRRKK